jgi:hypothetical protein
MNSRLFLALLALSVLLGTTSIALNGFWGRFQLMDRHHLLPTDHHRDAAQHFLGDDAATTPPRSTLVVYVFSDTDPQYRGNLEVFIQQGILKDDSADYYIVVQMKDAAAALDLPALPAYARYVKHSNECYDW